MRATLNKNGLATSAGEITVYNYDRETREYISSSIEYLAVGVGIPANSCTDKPGNDKTGFAICRTTSFDGWVYVTDHRGETVYDTTTGQPVSVTTPGEYADGVTTFAPSTPYDKWSGSEWVTNEDERRQGLIREAEQKKNVLLTQAQNMISLWQTALQLGILSEDDKTSLMAWMSYIQTLNVIDTSTAPDIKWPDMPQ